MRQSDRRVTEQGKTLYYLWKHETTEYEQYTRTYKRQRFEVGQYVAFFIVPPTQETVFIELKQITRIEPLDIKNESPVDDGAPRIKCTFRSDDRLKEYEKRLVIDWGRGFIAWCQHADGNEKQIIDMLNEDC